MMMEALNRFSNLVRQAWKCRTAISFCNLLKLCCKMYFGKKNALFSIKLKKYPHPIFLRARTTDCVLFAYIFLFDGGEYPVYKNYVPKFIIDAGANIGLATVFFKHHYPDATVVAIEPENWNCEMFKKNTALCKDVHLVQGGLGPDENKFMRVQNADDAFYSFRLEESAEGVPEITINSILAQYRPERIDILKIDIECGEKALFARNTEWIARVDNIFIEIHDYLEVGCSKAVLSVVKGDFFLNKKGENYLFSRDYFSECVNG